MDVRYIEGKVFVVHRDEMTPEELDDWCSYDDHFYVDCKVSTDKPRSSDLFEKLSKKSFKNCLDCVEHRRKELEERERLMESHEPLRGIELFAGAGGLSTGIEMSGFFKTRFAVEMCGSAVLTYR